MKQSAKIIFRVSPEMKAFVKEFSEKMNMEVSDFMRLMVEYYFLAQFSRTGSYREIKKKFFDIYDNPEKGKNDKQKK
jgi:hypothetical protein